MKGLPCFHKVVWCSLCADSMCIFATKNRFSASVFMELQTDRQTDAGPADLQASTVLRVRGKKTSGCQGMFIKWAKPCSPNFTQTPEQEFDLVKLQRKFKIQSIAFPGFLFVCCFFKLSDKNYNRMNNSSLSHLC